MIINVDGEQVEVERVSDTVKDLFYNEDKDTYYTTVSFEELADDIDIPLLAHVISSRLVERADIKIINNENK